MFTILKKNYFTKSKVAVIGLTDGVRDIPSATRQSIQSGEARLEKLVQ